MGAKQTSEPKQFIEHQRLNHVRIFETPVKNLDGEMQDIQKMELFRNVESEKHYNDWVVELRKINDAQGQDLFLVPDSHSFEKAGMCGSSGVVKLVFNKFEFVLSSEIKNRNNLNKYFDETQIWYVLYNLVRAGNKFEVLKQKIGDIHPNNILINEDGQTAIISSVSIPGEIDNFQRYIEDNKSEVFLAPEQMKQEDIDKGDYSSTVDKNLAEVWSLGMTLLSAGTLEHCNDVYLRNPLRIDKQRLKVLLGQFEKRYSPYLSQTLRSMLAQNPSERVRSKDLYNTLSHYEDQILDLEPFVPPYNAQYNNQGHFQQQNQIGYTQGGYGYTQGGYTKGQPPEGSWQHNYQQVPQQHAANNYNVKFNY